MGFLTEDDESVWELLFFLFLFIVILLGGYEDKVVDVSFCACWLILLTSFWRRFRLK